MDENFPRQLNFLTFSIPIVLAYWKALEQQKSRTLWFFVFPFGQSVCRLSGF
jgi:hypothetical protein